MGKLDMAASLSSLEDSPKKSKNVGMDESQEIFLTNNLNRSIEARRTLDTNVDQQVFTRDQILELYLNEIPYGGTVYGIQEASRRFFGKDAKDLTLAESAYLAALPQAPTYYSPYGNNLEALENRE